MKFLHTAKIADFYGMEHQVDKLEEEAKELVEAVKIYKAAKSPENKWLALQHLASEIGDVNVLVEQLKFFEPSLENLINADIIYKLNRESDRIDNFNDRVNNLQAEVRKQKADKSESIYKNEKARLM